MKKNIVLFIVFVFCLVSVIAQPPFQESSETTNIHILFPDVENLKISENVTLHYHLVNNSGFTYNNSKVDCIGHVYNNTNEHIIQKNLSNDINGVDKDLFINGTFLNNEGLYSINVWCNYSIFAGYTSHFFYINKDGKNNDGNVNNGFYFIGLLIGILFFVFLFLFISFNLDESHFILKSFFVMISIFFMLLIPRVLYIVNQSKIVIDVIKYSNRLVYIVVIYAFIYFIWKIADYYGKTYGVKQWFKDKFENKYDRGGGG